MKRTPVVIDSNKITVDLCKKAIKDASSGKTSRSSVTTILRHIDEKSKELMEMVVNNSFAPSPYVLKTIVERGKTRELTIPKFFPDQCVHHLLVLLMNKDNKLLKLIDPYSIASIPERGRNFGIDKLSKAIYKYKKKCIYCLKGDIKKCYPSITPEVAYNAVARYYKGDIFLNIMKQVLYNYTSLPLGIYLSGWIINLILKPFDEAIRSYKGSSKSQSVRVAKFYMRYMDDFVILGSNKRKLLKMRTLIKNELAKINLTVKFLDFFPIDKRPIDFMGFKLKMHRDPLPGQEIHIAHNKRIDQAIKEHDKDVLSLLGNKKKIFYKKNITLNKGLRSGPTLHIIRMLKRYAGYGCEKHHYTKHQLLGLLSNLGALKSFNSKLLIKKYIDKYGIAMYRLKENAYGRKIKNRPECPHDFVFIIQQHPEALEELDTLRSLFIKYYPEDYKRFGEFKTSRLVHDCREFFLKWVTLTPVKQQL